MLEELFNPNDPMYEHIQILYLITIISGYHYLITAVSL